MSACCQLALSSLSLCGPRAVQSEEQTDDKLQKELEDLLSQQLNFFQTKETDIFLFEGSKAAHLLEPLSKNNWRNLTPSSCTRGVRGRGCTYQSNTAVSREGREAPMAASVSLLLNWHKVSHNFKQDQCELSV